MTGRNYIRIAAIFLVSGVAAFGTAGAQDAPRPAQPGPGRAVLEQRLRERTGQVVKERLQLTDDQMLRLQASNRQFEQQRTALIAREREVRREMRQQLLSGDAANQNKVAQLLDQAILLERQRLDVVQNEQRELAKFLTPVQRAKLLALQTGLRRRAQELRSGAMPRMGGARRGPPIR